MLLFPQSSTESFSLNSWSLTWSFSINNSKTWISEMWDWRRRVFTSFLLAIFPHKILFYCSTVFQFKSIFPYEETYNRFYFFISKCLYQVFLQNNSMEMTHTETLQLLSPASLNSIGITAVLLTAFKLPQCSQVNTDWFS